MKKPSQKWKEFGQIIEIVNIRIGKSQRKLTKLKQERDEFELKIQNIWTEIDQEQLKLRQLSMANESDALNRLFRRRENIKSRIESLFFDASVNRQKVEKIEEKIKEEEKERKRLEKRKDALGEVRENLTS